MTDESLREIQLNGKQLVFVFMAATVVAVVIFLSGVLVGRTAPQGVALAASVEDTPGVMGLATASGGALDPLVVPAPTDGPIAAAEELEYPSYLEGAPPPETLEAPVETIAEPILDLPVERPAPAPPAQMAVATVPDTDVEEAAARAAMESPAAPASAQAVATRPVDPGGWVVQVAAVSERQAAEAIAADLSGKGYQAFVTTPGPDAPLVYRVRVGAFPDRRAAEAVSGRLEREEQFKPWVTR
jgi:DedD protein